MAGEVNGVSRTCPQFLSGNVRLPSPAPHIHLGHDSGLGCLCGKVVTFSEIQAAFSLVSQDEKNQMMTTNVWVKQVSGGPALPLPSP